jgi:hypothetical protein
MAGRHAFYRLTHRARNPSLPQRQPPSHPVTRRINE